MLLAFGETVFRDCVRKTPPLSFFFFSFITCSFWWVESITRKQAKKKGMPFNFYSLTCLCLQLWCYYYTKGWGKQRKKKFPGQLIPPPFFFPFLRPFFRGLSRRFDCIWSRNSHFSAVCGESLTSAVCSPHRRSTSQGAVSPSFFFVNIFLQPSWCLLIFARIYSPASTELPPKSVLM